MDFSTICRTCLSTEEISPIFANSENQDRLIHAVFIITGVKIEADDGYPQQLCGNCKNLLDATWTFRQKCLESETILKKIKQEIDLATLEQETDKKIIKSETCNDSEFVTEYVDFDILDEEDKPLTYLVKAEKDMLAAKKQNIHEKNMMLAAIRENIQKNNKMLADKKENMRKSNSKKQKSVLLSKIDCFPAIDELKRIFCKICHKNLSVHSIHIHMAKQHPGLDENRQKCEFCDKYIMKSKMSRHVKMAHSNEVMGFCCTYCKVQYPSKETLADHVSCCSSKIKKRSNNELGRQMSECSECGKRMQLASLRVHRAVAHAGLRPVCEHCGRKFGNKLRLQEHYRARHGYEKLKCGYCEFTSSSSTALKNHERRHLNEKPFVCEACGAKFHAAYLLAQHRQSHRSERVMRCKLCPSAFKANNSLHAHMRACHGAAQHKCPRCMRAYTSRVYAVRHLRTSHRWIGPVPDLRTVTKEDEET